ncbi:unnamed protein product [Rotaria magnacalcarata]|uniref:EF-hand domain-containing protein n=1 Tax=Rotaria magnacalcarata TaxID=392030 RepID=A0A816RF10_9BILA|nr:unnamed protein product [Rotaria magnacalcarata]CAF1460096.1 unnamed protein product [Rotaria magnacalcarata]CAF2070418.1 unnamed protein product [Rotaria magnacalcarata]CAF3785731.1 unnamed protein product [Rotaria magnacalcarata]CAF3826180.1 unnamed protein product [Rotaria magnacalcarata]
MGHEQQIGSSHDVTVGTSNDQTEQREMQNNPSLRPIERFPKAKEMPTTTTKKPSWQIVRDISMNILSRQATKLSCKPGVKSDLISSRPIIRQRSLYEASTSSKSRHPFQTPRMPTDKEATHVAIAYELFCSFCQGPCIGNYLRCRVCIKAYHSRCLFERGYINDPTFNLPRFSKQDWSCPECRDLTRLLDNDELNHLMQAFELIDTNQDGYITFEEFLSLQLNTTISADFHVFIQNNVALAKKYFSLMDSTQQGVIAWSDFALLYSCKIIAAKDKIELTAKLTKKEVVFAKTLFFKDPRKTFDNQSNIIITRKHFKQIYHDLIVLLENKYGIDFIRTILGDDDDEEEEISQKLSLMNWSEFLRAISLLILLNRSNGGRAHQQARATIPAHLSNSLFFSCSKLSTNEGDSLSRLTFSRIETPSTSVFLPGISFDNSFRKHAKILEKLNKQNQQAISKRKHTGSLMNYTIIEDIEAKENINLPKLKPDARDDRRAITDPWTSVKEIEQLRNMPILVKKTSVNIIKI